MLYIISTPIGNLEDITMRAINTLKTVDYIAAEDTRHSGILLKKYEITTPTISFHSYSDERKLDHLIELMKSGKTVGLISDAGTPGISDPAYALVTRAINEGIRVIPIPGASALLTALVGSGLTMHHFVYLGFLPLKKGRQTLLKSLVEEEKTIIIYESPHRILRTLEDLKTAFGERKIAVCRELTKLYEEFFRGTISEAIAHYKTHSIKGEFVIVLQGRE